LKLKNSLLTVFIGIFLTVHILSDCFKKLQTCVFKWKWKYQDLYQHKNNLYILNTYTHILESFIFYLVLKIFKIGFDLHISFFIWNLYGRLYIKYRIEIEKQPLTVFRGIFQYDVPFVKSALNFTVLAQKLLSKKKIYY
jgi:hypothetical protein